MPRRVSSFALTLLVVLLTISGELFAQGPFKSQVGITNYTPPERGLVGYTRGKSKQKKRVPTSTLVAPPEIIPESDGRFHITESSSDGEVITSSSPYLTERLMGTIPTGRTVRTASVTRRSTVGGGLLSDGEFVPDSSPVLPWYDGSPTASGDGNYLAPAQNTYFLTSGGTIYGEGGQVYDPYSPNLPAPVLDTPPSGYYSAIGEDGREEEESAVADFFVTPTIRRDGFFQQVWGEAEYIPNVGERKSGMTTFGGSARFALPFPDPDHLLMVTPRFSWTDLTISEYLEPIFGKKVGLYTGGIQGEWLAPLSQCFMLNLGFGASWNSDMKTSSSDALRFTGNVIGIWRWNETTRILVGASYQDISNWKIVPVFGISWRLNEDSYLDAVFPRAKAARRITWMRGIPEIEEGNSPYWIYVSGELSGGSWAIKPDGEERDLWGNNAKISYYDYRLLGGIEKKTTGDVNWAVEGGLVFARHLEIEGWTPAGFRDDNVRPKPAGIARLRLTF